MRFAIFTHVKHGCGKGNYVAYAPYVREMNLWLKHVEEVEVIAPLIKKRKDDAGLRGKGEYEVEYDHPNLKFLQIPSFNLLYFFDALMAIIRIPYIFCKILMVMARADHLHLRCPGNIGLLASIGQIFFPRKSKSAKYAGNWDPQAVQPWTYKLQKWILSNTLLTRNMQVLVYGDWPGQTKNIKSCFTASFSEQEISAVRGKRFDGPLTFLFVGNLVPGKHPIKAIQLVQEISSRMNLNSAYSEVSLEIYGDGPEWKMLEAYCRNENLEGLVEFKGSRTLEELKEAYQEAHFVILPSQSEGWPKAIAEGMFFGCIPIATHVSCVPWMLDYGKRGVLLEETGKNRISKNQQPEKRGQTEGRGCGSDTINVTLDTAKILDLIKDLKEMQSKSLAAKEWSGQYTLERFEAAIRDVLVGAARNTAGKK